MLASSCKVNGILDQELEDELMKFTTKHEESKVEVNLVEQTEKRIYTNTDMGVDIMECTKSDSGNEMVEAEWVDTTESSSSFDDSDCGVEDFDEAEVLSDSRGDAASVMDFDGFDDVFRMRKKKPTDHWRTFIEPLMWRCKWVELQIKKFEAEAEKYDRELERCSRQKTVRLEKFTVEDVGVKSLPSSKNYVRSEVFVRKKRRRDEETDDVAAYMSRHNLFSYYENREHFMNGVCMDIDLKSHAKATQKANVDDVFPDKDDLLRFENRHDDSFLENVLRKIDFLRSRVGTLKGRADKITNENAEKPGAVDNGFYGNDAATDNAVDGVSVGAYIVSQLIAEYKLSEFLVPGSAVKSREGVVRDANARTNRVYFADPIENGDYGILIDNPRMKDYEMNSFEQLKIQPLKRTVLADSDRQTDDQHTSNVCSILKATNTERTNKRDRDGRRVRFVV